MLDFGPKVLIVATALAVFLKAAGGCSFFAFSTTSPHTCTCNMYIQSLADSTKKSNRDLSFSKFTPLKKSRTVSNGKFLSCMFASDLKNAKPDGILRARNLAAVKAKEKQKAFASSCCLPLPNDLLHCLCEHALTGSRGFLSQPTAFLKTYTKAFPQRKHHGSSYAPSWM